MNQAALRRHLPTLTGYLDRRREAARNRLPKHLRPPVVWPIWVQVALNITLILTLLHLISNREEFLTEAAPAVLIIACFLFLFYTTLTGLKYRARYQKVRGRRLARINFWLIVIAGLCLPLAIITFLS